MTNVDPPVEPLTRAVTTTRTPRTHCKSGRHAWTEESTILDEGKRRCRLCHRAHDLNRSTKKRDMLTELAMLREFAYLVQQHVKPEVYAGLMGIATAQVKKQAQEEETKKS